MPHKLVCMYMHVDYIQELLTASTNLTTQHTHTHVMIHHDVTVQHIATTSTVVLIQQVCSVRRQCGVPITIYRCVCVVSLACSTDK